MARLDILDREIIMLLNQNARLSGANIARRLDISPRTVRNRIHRLVDQDVIRPVAVVNPQAFGYQLAVDIFCEIDIGEVDQVVRKLASLPEITYLAYSTGEQDLSLQAVFKNGDEMQAFITQSLPRVSGIRRIRTALVPRIVKDACQWVPPNHDLGKTVNPQESDKTSFRVRTE